MGRLHEKIAIVTGAAQGLGKAQAELFAKEGAKVVATDVQEDALKETVQAIIDQGGTATWLKHDVSSPEDWQSVIKKTIETYGRLDILVNNAGISHFQNITDTSLEDWNRVLTINATGAFLGMKNAIPEMQKQGGGAIVNMSSAAGMTGDGFAAYNASKAAIRALSKNAAVDYAKDKIRVNSVHPGMIVTPMTEPFLAIEEARKIFEEKTALPYLGQPEDVAHAVLFLASDEAKFVTGSEFVVDGGLLVK